jgi:hypothetical protein
VQKIADFYGFCKEVQIADIRSPPGAGPLDSKPWARLAAQFGHIRLYAARDHPHKLFLQKISKA